MKKFVLAGIVILLIASSLFQSCVYSGPPQIVTFQSTPANINPGEAVTIIWVVTGANSISIDPGIGSVPLAGSRQVNPTETTKYTLTAGNASGTANASLTVTVKSQAVNPVNNPPSIAIFNASPSTINAGNPSLLSWTVNGADSVKIDPGIGVVGSVDSRSIYPSSTTTYTLTANNQAASVSASVTIIVNPGNVNLPPPASKPQIILFTIFPPTVNNGYPATLEWNVSGASSVFINQGVGLVPPYGSRIINPTASTTYVLTAQNGAGQITANASVDVINGNPADYLNLPQITYFTLAPSSISPGGSATLRWNVVASTQIFIDNGVGFVPPSGTMTVSPSATTWYTLTATNGYGSVASVAVVGVNP
jgi:hypothetical protein